MTSRVFSPRFLAAAFASLILHAALMSGGWLRAPAVKVERLPPLEARLVPLPPEPPAVQAGQRPRREPRRIQRPAPAKPVPPVATAPSASTYSIPQPAIASESFEPPAPEAPGTDSKEAAVAPTVESVPAPDPPESIRTFPRKGRMAYTAYFGEDRFTIGKTVQTWEVDAEGYKLGSVSETTGIVELFRSQRHIYLSEGRFTPRGLQPLKFFMSRTRRGRTEAAQALFDWDAGTLTFGRVPHKGTAPLTPGAQDIVSFMYQLALFPPPPGRMRLPISNGSRFETYELDVLEEERIETTLGILRALPVKQIPRPGDESVAIWLAVDYHFLPVKIRFFDREGRPTGEQVVDTIEVSEE